MIIKTLTLDDAKPSIMTGGYHIIIDARPGSIHYIWDTKIFVKGTTLDGKLDIPLTAKYVPHLFTILEIQEHTRQPVTVYRVPGIGVGIAFHDCVGPENSNES